MVNKDEYIYIYKRPNGGTLTSGCESDADFESETPTAYILSYLATCMDGRVSE